MTEKHLLPPSRLTEDRWFANLDDRPIQVGTERRRVRILGVHRDGPEVWIQLSPLQDSDRDFVIRCWDRQRTADFLAKLSVHLRTGRSTPHMIDARSWEVDAQSAHSAEERQHPMAMSM